MDYMDINIYKIRTLIQLVSSCLGPFTPRNGTSVKYVKTDSAIKPFTLSSPTSNQCNVYLQIFSELVEEDHQKRWQYARDTIEASKHYDANKTTDAARLPYATMNSHEHTKAHKPCFMCGEISSASLLGPPLVWNSREDCTIILLHD